MMDGFLRICRLCNTAFYDTFPRMNCQCGQNDPVPESRLESSPAGDYSALDPYGYDSAPPAPDADRANGRDAPFDDSLFWWS